MIGQKIETLDPDRVAKYVGTNLGPEFLVTIKCPDCRGESRLHRIFTDPKGYKNAATANEAESILMHLAHRLDHSVVLTDRCQNCFRTLNTTITICDWSPSFDQC